MRVEDLALLVAENNEREIVDAQIAPNKEEAQKVIEAINLKYENDIPKREKVLEFLLEHRVCGSKLIKLYEDNEKDVEKMIAGFGELNK